MITLLNIKNIDKVSELIIECFIKINSKDLTKDELDKACKYYEVNAFRSHIKDNDIIFIYIKDTEIVGTITITDNRIRNVFVKVSEQWKWFGKDLVLFAIDHIKRVWMYKECFLFSSDYAIWFYKNLWFIEWNKKRIEVWQVTEMFYKL